MNFPFFLARALGKSIGSELRSKGRFPSFNDDRSFSSWSCCSYAERPTRDEDMADTAEKTGEGIVSG